MYMTGGLVGYFHAIIPLIISYFCDEKPVIGAESAAFFRLENPGDGRQEIAIGHDFGGKRPSALVALAKILGERYFSRAYKMRGQKKMGKSDCF
jgi:hypothetical protein